MTTQGPPEGSNPNSFICDCEEDLRHACASEGFYKKKGGKRYCVLHYPGNEKKEDFEIALDKKLSADNNNFSGVWFPKGVRFKKHKWDRYTDFSSASFNGDIDFSGVAFNFKAHFYNASFNAGADFGRVIFSEGAEFSGASFSKDANFDKAKFGKDANFNDVSFSGNVSFSSASFSDNASFRNSRFSAADFTEAIFDRDVYFNGVSFDKDANFSAASFSGAPQFSQASFSAAAGFLATNFTAGANFISASFSAVNFYSASFGTAADFSYANFSDAVDFNSTSFAAANFKDAKFSAAVDFSRAIFSGAAQFLHARFSAAASFIETTFKDYFHFAGNSAERSFGDQQRFNFQFTHFEKPDRVSFHTLDLKPHWFVNVDIRKFEFTDVEFNYDLKVELERMKDIKVDAPHRLLAIACRQLADNAEANHRYLEASRFRYNSFEARRIESFYGFIFWRLDWWYWLASGYGESVLRAFIVFVVLIGLFTIGYKNADFDPTSKTAITKPMSAVANSSPSIPDTQPRRLGWREAALYSFNVSILQKPEPKPMGLRGNVLVSLETVLGPAQAALLALALRRRFMR